MTMSWNNDSDSANEEPTQRAVAFTVDGRAVEIDAPISKTKQWDHVAEEEELKQIRVRLEAVTWNNPEVGMSVQEKWIMDDGTVKWFSGAIREVNRRVYKIRWKDGSKTMYYRSSWELKLNSYSDFKILE
jgi:hypothetical protein